MNSGGEHVIDLAELYALGALEPEELRAVDAHVATCAPCRIAVGRAEATVTALDDAFVANVDVPPQLAQRIARAARDVVTFDTFGARHQPRAPRALAAPTRGNLAAAAVFALAIGSAAAAISSHEVNVGTALARNDVALATIVNSHFNHVQFVARAPGAPRAKALYARDGRWLYVVIDSPACACHVVVMHDGAAVDLGVPQTAPGSTTETVFTSSAGRPSSVELVGTTGATLASATLTYSK